MNLICKLISFRKWQNREHSLLLNGSRYDSSGGVLILYEFFAFTDAASLFGMLRGDRYDDKNNRAAHISQKHYYQTRVTVLIVIFNALFHSGVL